MEIGKKIKEARLKAGLTQDQVSEAIQVSRQTLSNWENGRYYPDIASVIKLSDLYKISLDELLKGEKMKLNQEVNDNVFEQLDGHKDIIIFSFGGNPNGSAIQVGDFGTPYATKLAARMNKYAKKNKLDIKVDIGSYINLDKRGKEADIILLSPELHAQYEEIKNMFSDKKVRLIAMRDFGLLNVESILKQALS